LLHSTSTYLFMRLPPPHPRPQESLYSTFFTYLLMRLPPALGGHVVSQLAHFGLTSAMPSVVNEAAVMFGTATGECLEQPPVSVWLHGRACWAVMAGTATGE
jgi:hypothetical protein